MWSARPGITRSAPVPPGLRPCQIGNLFLDESLVVHLASSLQAEGIWQGGIPMPTSLRDLEGGEWRALRQLAHSRTASARLVERARIIWLAAQGESLTAIGRTTRRSLTTVRLWLRRFNDQGLAGLQDSPRSGRP